MITDDMPAHHVAAVSIESPFQAAPGKVKPARRCKPGTKFATVVAYLASGRDLNRFEGERRLGDHCLNSTIAEIEAHGVTVSRKWEQVLGFTGLSIRVRRYWLSEIERTKAAAMLGEAAEKRSQTLIAQAVRA